MPRRFAFVIVGAACLIVGIATGLLTARKIDADWFEAVGTWVGALVSAAAVVLAVLIFRTEDFIRRVGDARETQREQTRRELEARSEQQQADSVIGSVRFGYGHDFSNGVMQAKALRLQVQNNTDDKTITDVRIRFYELYGSEWHLLEDALRPGQLHTSMPELPVELGLPEGNKSLRGRAEFRYVLGGVTWTRLDGESARRLELGS